MDPDSTLASYLRTVCPDADLSGSAPRPSPSRPPWTWSARGARDRHRRRGRAGRPAGQPQADRLRELRLPGHPAGHGQLAVGQVRRGLARAPLLRRLRERRHHRARAVELAKGLFGSDHAYVQPHSGIDANLVAFWSILTRRVEGPALERLGAKDLQGLPDTDWESLRRELGNQRLLGMALDGGHLTHGFRPNVSGKLFEIARYTVDPTTGLLDYDQVRKQAESFRPLILLAGYSSYPRKINFRIFREIADEVGPCSWSTWPTSPAWSPARCSAATSTGGPRPRGHHHHLQDAAGPRADGAVHRGVRPHRRPGLPAGPGRAARPHHGRQGGRPDRGRPAGVRRLRPADRRQRRHPGRRPQQQGATVVTGGTDNHLLLVDARPYGLTGRQAETALREAGITLNRNVIPFDPNGSWYTSGLRLGTPAATTLGMGADEMREVASIVHTVLEATRPVPDSKAGTARPGRPRPGLRRAGDLLDRFPCTRGSPPGSAGARATLGGRREHRSRAAAASSGTVASLPARRRPPAGRWDLGRWWWG